MSDADEVYRLASSAEVPEDAWHTRSKWIAGYVGVPGLDEEFIHCSTAEQVVGTAGAYFAGKTDLVLLVFSVELMCEEADLEVRWEDAAPAPGIKQRDGEFPHVYGGPIPYACLVSPPVLLGLDPGGKHVFPPFGPKMVLDTSQIANEHNHDEAESDDDEHADCVDCCH